MGPFFGMLFGLLLFNSTEPELLIPPQEPPKKPEVVEPPIKSYGRDFEELKLPEDRQQRNM